MHSLIARFAENAFWMARYVERAENLARILHVNETFARSSDGGDDWAPILALHQDLERYREAHAEISGTGVARFYLVDRENPNAIVNAIVAARENARSIRHLISVETWSQLNVFANRMRALKPREVAPAQLSRLCDEIKEACQLHTGIVTSTLYRDQVASFYWLGRLIERCDQTTRLVDIKYHRLLPSPEAVGSAIDVAQWNALLRSAAAYHGYRRVHPRAMTPKTVSSFILFDPNFPRSIRACVDTLARIMDDLTAAPELAGVGASDDLLAPLDALAARPPGEVIASGLHEFLDETQLELIRLTRRLGLLYFAHDAAEAAG